MTDKLLVEAGEMCGNGTWQMSVHRIICKALNKNPVQSVTKHISHLVLAAGCDPLSGLSEQRTNVSTSSSADAGRKWLERWKESLPSRLVGIALPELSVKAHCGKKAIKVMWVPQHGLSFCERTCGRHACAWTCWRGNGWNSVTGSITLWLSFLHHTWQKDSHHTWRGSGHLQSNSWDWETSAVPHRHPVKATWTGS